MIPDLLVVCELQRLRITAALRQPYQPTPRPRIAPRPTPTTAYVAPLPEWAHGRTVSYDHHGCRCDRCRAAHTAYSRTRPYNAARHRRENARYRAKQKGAA